MTRNEIIATVLLATATVVIVRYYLPRIETKMEVVEKEVIKKDIVTVTKEVVKADGTKETVTTTTDNSTEKKSSKDTTISVAHSQWLVSLGTSRTLSDSSLSYSLQAQRRILGPMFVGGTIDTKGTFGINVGMEF